MFPRHGAVGTRSPKARIMFPGYEEESEMSRPRRHGTERVPRSPITTRGVGAQKFGNCTPTTLAQKKKNIASRAVGPDGWNPPNVGLVCAARLPAIRRPPSNLLVSGGGNLPQRQAPTCLRAWSVADDQFALLTSCSLRLCSVSRVYCCLFSKSTLSRPPFFVSCHYRCPYDVCKYIS